MFVHIRWMLITMFPLFEKKAHVAVKKLGRHSPVWMFNYAVLRNAHSGNFMSRTYLFFDWWRIVSALIFRFVPKRLGKNSSAQLYGIIWLSILIKLWISINKIYCELGWNILPQWSYSISAPSVLQPGVKYLHICDQGSHSGASEDWWLHDLVYCICTLWLTNWAG